MATEPSYTTSLEISELRLDCGVTPRYMPNRSIIDLYAHRMKEGEQFPPVITFQDPQNPADFWLADGHQRIAALKECGEVYVSTNVYRGTRHDAMFYACRANGEERGNKDKQAAITAILKEPELTKMSDRMLAIRCKVHHTFISRLRKKLGLVKPERIMTQSGYTINTSHIGKPVKYRKDGKRLGLREGMEDRDTRKEQIAKLAKNGLNAEQIATELKISVERVRVLATEANITFMAIGGRKLNHQRILDSTVMSLDASAAGLRTTGIVVDGLDKDEVRQWIESLNESLQTFTALRNKLRGYVNG